ncbi:hypothetical protein D3C72_1733180 [compost metagenome]
MKKNSSAESRAISSSMRRSWNSCISAQVRTRPIRVPAMRWARRWRVAPKCGRHTNTMVSSTQEPFWALNRRMAAKPTTRASAMRRPWRNRTEPGVSCWRMRTNISRRVCGLVSRRRVSTLSRVESDFSASDKRRSMLCRLWPSRSSEDSRRCHCGLCWARSQLSESVRSAVACLVRSPYWNGRRRRMARPRLAQASPCRASRRWQRYSTSLWKNASVSAP